MADLNTGITPPPDNPSGYVPPAASDQQPQDQQPQPQPQDQTQTAPAGGQNMFADTIPGSQQAAPPAQRQNIFADVLSQQAAVSDSAAKASEAYLTDQARKSFDLAPSNTWSGWINRVGRSMSFGLGDYVIAARIQHANPNVPFHDALKAVEQKYAADTSTSADITGAIIGGAGVVGDLGRLGRVGSKLVGASPSAAANFVGDFMRGGLARDGAVAAARGGFADGALAWASRNPALARIAGTAAIGGSSNAAYEAIRSSVAYSIDQASHIDQMTPATVASDVAQGALVGAILSPALSEAARALGGPARALGRVVQSWWGGDAAKTAVATHKIIGTLAKATGKTPDEAVQSIQNAYHDFKAMNPNSEPALAQLIGADAAAEIGAVSAYHSGIGAIGSRLGAEQIPKVLNNLANVVKRGGDMQHREVLRNGVSNLFRDFMAQNGDIMVNVPDSTIASLRNAPKFLSHMASSGNIPAQRIKAVLDAQDSIVSLRNKFVSLMKASNVANLRSQVADINQQIAQLIDAKMAEGGGASEIAQLRNAARLIATKASAIASRSTKTSTALKMSELEPNLQAAQKILDNYAENGLKVPLRAANDLRMAASRAAYGADPSIAESAMNTRDAVASIGAKEVKDYPKMVSLWNQTHTRMDAQSLGAQAAKGSETPENIGAMLESGRAPGRGAGDMTSVAQGADEGARITITHALDQPTGEAGGMVKRLAESGATQKSLDLTSPKAAKQIVAAAKSSKEQLGGLHALMNLGSPKEISAQATAMQEFFAGAGFGRLGGAARANLVTKFLMSKAIPRSQAKLMIEGLGDPARLPDVLNYMRRRGVDPQELAKFMAKIVIAEQNAKKRKGQ